MKTLISLLTLIAIVFAYGFSATLYLQGAMILSYLLVISSITALTFWIKSHDILHVEVSEKA